MALSFQDWMAQNNVSQSTDEDGNPIYVQQTDGGTTGMRDAVDRYQAALGLSNSDPNYGGGGIVTGPDGKQYYTLGAQTAAQAQGYGYKITTINGQPAIDPSQPNIPGAPPIRGGIGSGALLADQQQEGFGDFAKMVASTFGPVAGFTALGSAGLLGGASGGADAAAAGGGAATGGAAAGASQFPDLSLSGTLGGGTGTAVAGNAANAAAGGAVNAATGLGDYSLASGVGGGLGGAATLGAGGLPTSLAGSVTNALTSGGGADTGTGATTSNLGTAAGTAAAGTAASTLGIPNNILGGIAQGALGLAGANAQGNAYSDVASQYLALGQHGRDQYNAYTSPGFDITTLPGLQSALTAAADTENRALSVNGNPADNPGMQEAAQKYLLGSVALPQYNTAVSQALTAGGLGVNTAGTGSLSAAGSTGDAYNAIGAGLNTALNPPTDIASLLKQLGTTGSQNYSLNIGGVKA